jgi:hypothetical protein
MRVCTLIFQRRILEFQVIVKDVIKDDFGGKLPSGRRQDVRPRPCLSRERGFTRGWVFTICRRGKKRVHADATMCPRGPSPSLPSTVRADAKINKNK